MGLINNFMLCMIHGIPLAMIETLEFLKRPALWLRALAITGATTTWAPNFGYALATQRITDSELEQLRLDHVRGFWNAAERIHLETMLAFQKRFEHYGVTLDSLKTNFGCAENVGGATFSDPESRFVSERVRTSDLYGPGIAQVVGADDHSSKTVDVVSVGRPFPRMSIKIVSPTGRELPDGTVGEISLDTPSQMRGYLKNSRETNRAIKGGALRTGDLGYKRGEELFWVGRVKERINLHGKKFDPSDFERPLLQVEGLRKGCFAAFGVDDTTLGTQRLVIVSETRNDCQVDEADILKSVKSTITEQVGVTVDELVLLPHGTMSKTSSGKRRHRFYRQEYLDGNLQTLAGSRTHTA
jgi:acyl-CoA synthetase (AMP-forming)/AMP-acid ligase II